MERAFPVTLGARCAEHSQVPPRHVAHALGGGVRLDAKQGAEIDGCTIDRLLQEALQQEPVERESVKEGVAAIPRIIGPVVARLHPCDRSLYALFQLAAQLSLTR